MDVQIEEEKNSNERLDLGQIELVVPDDIPTCTPPRSEHLATDNQLIDDEDEQNKSEGKNNRSEPGTPRSSLNAKSSGKMRQMIDKTLALGKKASSYMSEKASKIKEGWQGFKQKSAQSWNNAKRKLKTYIGKVTDAPEFARDNEFIITGYRINHNTCCKMIKSLCTCHNESVNVWTHLCGAIMFIALFIILIVTFPRQFVHGNLLMNAFEEIEPQQGADLFFLDQLVDLEQNVNKVVNLPVSIESDDIHNWIELDKRVALFGDELLEIQEQSEGLSYFLLAVFYDFNYMSMLDDSPTVPKEMVELWSENLVNYSERIEGVTDAALQKIIDSQDTVVVKTSIAERMYFTSQRLHQYIEEVTELTALLQKSLLESPIVDQEDISVYDQLNDRIVEVAPGFKSAEYILNYISVMPLVINILAAVFNLSCSAIFHLCYVKSERLSQILSRLDYGGISIMVFGGCTPLMCYSFACDGVALKRWIFIAVMGAGMIGTFTASLVPSFDTPKWRPVRGVMFIVFGVSTVGIMISFLWESPAQMVVNCTWFAVGGAIYVAGAVIYVLRIPERCKPGKFDICGASHQIFHFAVLIGSIMHYHESYYMFYQRQGFECPIWDK